LGRLTVLEFGHAPIADGDPDKSGERTSVIRNPQYRKRLPLTQARA
jgi:hypothetical protein